MLFCIRKGMRARREVLEPLFLVPVFVEKKKSGRFECPLVGVVR
jgi:hypothetical protein